jgi:hypothetical protein
VRSRNSAESVTPECPPHTLSRKPGQFGLGRVHLAFDRKDFKPGGEHMVIGRNNVALGWNDLAPGRIDLGVGRFDSRIRGFVFVSGTFHFGPGGFSLVVS